MIRSMTGYGSSEIIQNDKKIDVELKSVNHKYLDVNIKMPRSFIKFETEIRNLLKKYAVRGKIDIFITYENLASSTSRLKYDAVLAKEYFDCYKQMCIDLGVEEEIRICNIARSPEVLTLEDVETDEEELWTILKSSCIEAFEKFRTAREKEGAALKEDILLKLDEMSKNVDFIESRLPDIISEYKLKLEEKVKEFLENSQIDDNRIAAEVTVFADKCAVDEELVRLQTHIINMRDTLMDGGEKGRNLDFLAQEMNRESNTILSKSSDIEVTNCGIELKTCIEKIREQVQNIE